MEKIFKWFTIDDDISVVYVMWFAEMFEPEDFIGIDRLFFLFLKFCAFLGVPAKREYLESYLVTDGKTAIKTNGVKLDTMSAYDYKDPTALEEAYRIVGKAALDVYDKWCTVDLSDKTFKVEMFHFLKKQKHDAVQQSIVSFFPKLQDGSDIDEVTDAMQLEIERKCTIYDVNKLDELDFMSGNQKSRRARRPMRKLFETGVPCIDGDAGGMYTQQIYTLNGQPGSGKTRFVMRFFIYMALINGQSVIYVSVEMTEEQVMNMLIAIHIMFLYGGQVKIPDRDMNQDNLTSEQRQYYESARIDLFESGKYGKLFFKKSGPVEKMKKETMNLIKRNRDITLWVIDYMGRLKSEPLSKYDRAKQQYEIITDAYEVVRDVVDTCDVGAVCLNQYNDKGIAAALAGKTIQPGYVEGGHIVQRHTDYDLSMTFTEEQKIAKLRSLSTTKERANAGFRNVMFQTELSVSIFQQVSQT